MNYPHVQTRFLFVSALIEIMLNYSYIQVCRVRFLYFQIKLCFFSPHSVAHVHSLLQSHATRSKLIIAQGDIKQKKLNKKQEDCMQL